MGNIGVKINGEMFSTDINTQEPPSLQKNLRRMRDYNTNYCVMEVSSQGLDMKRVLGCDFNIAIFTNLTQDHLDYHQTFEEYRNAKGMLFSRLGSDLSANNNKYAILNADDPNIGFFKKISSGEVITYGIQNNTDVAATNIRMTSQGIQYILNSFKGTIEINLHLVGKFNIYNSLAAIAAALVEGISLKQIQQSISKLKSISGRMEIVDNEQELLVLVDYAHTPDALENALKSIKEFSSGKILTVFGCGGDRDKGKRSLMGEIASKYSDLIFITSDNPRNEDPKAIIDDIEKGINMINKVNYECIVNREKAIKEAIRIAKPGDIILIAGKGHETYQQFKDKTIHFDDREVAKKSIKRNTKQLMLHVFVISEKFYLITK